MRSQTVHKNPIRSLLLAGIILSSLAFNPLMGQITSAAADRVDSLAYPVKEGKDPHFIFYQIKQVFKAGTLTATLPGNGSYNFEWSRYDASLPGFGPAFSSESNVQASSISNLEGGAYRVRIYNGTGTDTSMMAWVTLDRLYAGIEKTDEGHLDPKHRDCARLALFGFVEEDTLLYYDPISHDLLTRPLDYSFKWTSDNEDLIIPNNTTILAPNITYLPPFEDTWYILTVTDEMGMVDVDSVFYVSIQTKAIFSVEFNDKVLNTKEDSIWDAELQQTWNKEKGSTDAPLTVRFINESKNGAVFEWVFLDTLGGIKETETTYSKEEMPEFIYKNAYKYYYPSLLSISEEGCEDSVSLAEGIFVAGPSILEIPNVFTPNGDDQNDIWAFKHQSLKTCKVTVVDRTGKVVYKKKIEDIYLWEGWNGNMHDSGRRAPEGQYYFVVEAMGYDGLEHREPTIWENMKIFGGPGNNTGGSGTTGTSPGGTDPEEEAQTLYTGWLYLFRH